MPNAGGHALASLAADADAFIKSHIVADTAHLGQHSRPVTDQGGTLYRGNHFALFDLIGFRTGEDELAADNIDLPAVLAERLTTAHPDVLRELLAHTPESVRWPSSLDHALGTRGFAKEVHAVLSRAREKGLEGPELAQLGRDHDAPELVAAGLFLDSYLTNLDAQGATDYPDLIRRATLEAEVHRDELRSRLRHVFVDEYQDTDPGQVALLRALAGDGRDLVVVGDPHQSIYAFRGAEVRGILEFPTQFPPAL